MEMWLWKTKMKKTKRRGRLQDFSLKGYWSRVKRLIYSGYSSITSISTYHYLTLGCTPPQTFVEKVIFVSRLAFPHFHQPSIIVTIISVFTVVCAIAARFDPDPSLHVKCYEEAHHCFVSMVAEGERSLESVQACLLLTAWCSAPKGWEDRPQRAWLYFGMAVRMGMELGLFRPPSFTEGRPELKPGVVKNSAAWKAIGGIVGEEAQKEALNRERTWLLAFVIDRYMSAVMGRPYQIHEVRPVLIPTHPMISPLDHGIIAHVELQSIMGQVSFIDTRGKEF
jgi:hypothetical protein